MDLTNAIASLYPNATWTMDGDIYETLWWPDTNEQPRPTKQMLKKEITRLKKQATKNEYARQRASAYPAVEDQLDMLWHMMDLGQIPGKDSEWYNQILAVKQEYPKQK